MGSRLEVRSLVGTVYASRSCQDSSAVRCCAGLGKELTEALQHVDLAAVGDRGGVWVVRSLDVAVSVAPQWNGRECAKALSSGLFQALRQACSSQRSDAKIAWFPSREAHLADFILAEANGRRPHDWRFCPFERHFVLGRPASIVSPLTEDRESGSAALACMSPSERRSVYLSMGESGTARALSVWAENGAVSALSTSRALRLVETVLGLASETDVAALAIEATVLASDGETGGDLLRDRAAFAKAVTAFLKVWLQASPPLRSSLTTALMAKTVTDPRSGGAETWAAVTALWPCDADVRHRLAAEVEQRTSVRSEEVQRLSGLAGAYHLLPTLEDFEFESVFADWPDCEGTSACAAAKLVVLKTALGVQWSDLCSDTALLRAVSASKMVNGQAIEDWAMSTDLAVVAIAEAEWKLRAAYNARSGFQTTSESAADWQGKVVTIAADDRSGFWTSISTDGPEPDSPMSRNVADDVNTLASGTLCQARAFFTVAAQNVVRGFALKLPGFANAGVNHLRRQVLTGRAFVEWGRNETVVKCEPPPLAVVLNMAGVGRSEFTLRSTGQRRWKLQFLD